MKIKCLIVDDEELARMGLMSILSDKEMVEIVGVCKDGIEAIEIINREKPQLVFLDVQMPGVNGFEVIASLPKPRPHIIFVTAHDQYAINAFEINAVDYLLKPFSDDRFEKAFSKALKIISNETISKQLALEQLIVHAKESMKSPTRLVTGLGEENSIIIKSEGQVHKVLHEELSYIEAYDYYIKIHVPGSFFLIRESMKNILAKLPATYFIRIHKSYIVNLKMIKQFGRGIDSGYQVILSSGECLNVSRSYKAELQRIFK